MRSHDNLIGTLPYILNLFKKYFQYILGGAIVFSFIFTIRVFFNPIYSSQILYRSHQSHSLNNADSSVAVANLTRLLTNRDFSEILAKSFVDELIKKKEHNSNQNAYNYLVLHFGISKLEPEEQQNDLIIAISNYISFVLVNSLQSQSIILNKPLINLELRNGDIWAIMVSVGKRGVGIPIAKAFMNALAQSLQTTNTSSYQELRKMADIEISKLETIFSVISEKKITNKYTLIENYSELMALDNKAFLISNPNQDASSLPLSFEEYLSSLDVLDANLRSLMHANKKGSTDSEKTDKNKLVENIKKIQSDLLSQQSILEAFKLSLHRDITSLISSFQNTSMAVPIPDTKMDNSLEYLGMVDSGHKKNLLLNGILGFAFGILVSPLLFPIFRKFKGEA